jgi:hypothetical protein
MKGPNWYGGIRRCGLTGEKCGRGAPFVLRGRVGTEAAGMVGALLRDRDPRHVRSRGDIATRILGLPRAGAGRKARTWLGLVWPPRPFSDGGESSNLMEYRTMAVIRLGGRRDYRLGRLYQRELGEVAIRHMVRS